MKLIVRVVEKLRAVVAYRLLRLAQGIMPKSARYKPATLNARKAADSVKKNKQLT